MGSEQIQQVSRMLVDLEDYLREQCRLALSVGHTADARAFQTALKMTLAAREQLGLPAERNRHATEDVRSGWVQ